MADSKTKVRILHCNVRKTISCKKSRTCPAAADALQKSERYATKNRRKRHCTVPQSWGSVEYHVHFRRSLTSDAINSQATLPLLYTSMNEGLNVGLWYIFLYTHRLEITYIIINNITSRFLNPATSNINLVVFYKVSLIRNQQKFDDITSHPSSHKNSKKTSKINVLSDETFLLFEN